MILDDVYVILDEVYVIMGRTLTFVRCMIDFNSLGCFKTPGELTDVYSCNDCICKLI